jgi:hypothetical protein
MARMQVKISVPEPMGGEYVELHSGICLCGGVAYRGRSPFGVRPCDFERGPIVRVIVDAREWLSAGSPPSLEDFRETRALAPDIPDRVSVGVTTPEGVLLRPSHARPG